jgi:hypothetical protein
MLIEAHYLPNISYFVAILQAEQVWIDGFEHFEKQSFRNRCQVRTTNKIDTLVVPIQHLQPKMPLREVRIEYRQDWLRRHWGALYSGYGRAPFFEYYAPYFQDIFQKKHDFLLDLNVELLTICLKFLKIGKPLYFTEKYYSKYEWTISEDFRSRIHPKKLDETLTFFHPQRYTQNFGNEFESNLSIFDLLMCQGPQARSLLEASAK